MPKIKNIKDVVDWGMCIGCGACYYACQEDAIALKNIESQGIRPIVDTTKCTDNCICLDVCPGYQVDSGLIYDISMDYKKGDDLFGPTLEIWEGYASDPDIRHSASSGGALTALALYCLEKENMEFVLHAGMDNENPLQNKTFKSFNKNDLLLRTGSRYAPASPCDSLEEIEKSNKKCVFIGKPCDTAAVAMARKKNEKLSKNLGLVLTFFCAGAPSNYATNRLLGKMEVPLDNISDLRYRGEGWPGNFKVTYNENLNQKSMSYKESWHELQKFRSFRCHLCPDGLGQIADISCGDAWHKYNNDNQPGLSIILVRTEKGKNIFHNAIKTEYLKAYKSNTESVVSAQGLIKRKPEIFGRLLSLRIFMIPIPVFIGFNIFKSWLTLPIVSKIRTVIGTVKRIFSKGLWHKNIPFEDKQI